MLSKPISTTCSLEAIIMKRTTNEFKSRTGGTTVERTEEGSEWEGPVRYAETDFECVECSTATDRRFRQVGEWALQTIVDLFGTVRTRLRNETDR